MPPKDYRLLEWAGDFYPTQPACHGVTVRAIPALGNCGWIALALVTAAKAKDLPKESMIKELKDRMVEELNKNPAAYELAVAAAEVGTLEEYKQKIRGAPYQTDHLDLQLLSAVIGVTIHVVGPSTTSTIGLESNAVWCMLGHKAGSHYDLVYHLDTRGSSSTPLFTQQQAKSAPVVTAVQNFIVRQAELDAANRAADDSASLAAIAAMDDVPSSDSDSEHPSSDSHAAAAAAATAPGASSSSIQPMPMSLEAEAEATSSLMLSPAAVGTRSRNKKRAGPAIQSNPKAQKTNNQANNKTQLDDEERKSEDNEGDDDEQQPSSDDDDDQLSLREHVEIEEHDDGGRVASPRSS